MFLSRIRALLGKRSKHSDAKYLPSTRIYYNSDHDEQQGHNGHDHTSSILTISTNATMDNNPGTGRTIDTHLYQFLGRKLERFIFRISMANLPPDRILQYLQTPFLIFPVTSSPLGDVMQTIEKGDKIAGLKSLVKQSK